jgi:hypothetical protein
MTFWNGSHWVQEAAPPSRIKPSRLQNWAATCLMVAGFALVAMPLAATYARSSTPHAAPSCGLAAVTLAGTDVVQITASGLPHGANFEISWTEPQITQTQYYWSTNQGTLQDTVLNNQGPGEYTASVWWRSNKGNVWETSCSMDVGY